MRASRGDWCRCVTDIIAPPFNRRCTIFTFILCRIYFNQKFISNMEIMDVKRLTTDVSNWKSRLRASQKQIYWSLWYFIKGELETLQGNREQKLPMFIYKLTFETVVSATPMLYSLSNDIRYGWSAGRKGEQPTGQDFINQNSDRIWGLANANIP